MLVSCGLNHLDPPDKLPVAKGSCGGWLRLGVLVCCGFLFAHPTNLWAVVHMHCRQVSQGRACLGWWRVVGAVAARQPLVLML